MMKRAFSKSDGERTFFTEGGGGRFSCIPLFVWRAQKLVHNPYNATKLEKKD